MFNRIASFSPVLVAAVHKSAAPVLVADAIGTAAEKYASNAGAKNLLTAVAAACRTTDKGKARTPAAGTVAALILSAVDAILSGADAIGARPGTGTTEERATLAADFGERMRADFVAAVDAAALARRALRAKPAKPADVPDSAPGAADGTTDSAPAVPSIDSISGSVALAALASLDAAAFSVAALARPGALSALRAPLAIGHRCGDSGDSERARCAVRCRVIPGDQDAQRAKRVRGERKQPAAV